MLVDENTVR